MEQEEFWRKYNNREFENLYSEFERGLKFNFDLEQETKQASWGEDYELLHFLWKIGAKGETPFIEDIFDKFNNGESFTQMANRKAESEKKKKADVSADLTAYNSIKDLPIGKIELRLHDHSEFYLHIEIKPYLYDDYVVEPDGLHFGPLRLNQDLLSNDRIEFAPNEFDESIYLFHSHNPVDLKSIEFQKISDTEILIKAEILFNFKFENNGENEILIIEKTTHNNV